MKNKQTNIISSIKIIILGTVLGLGVGYLQAYTPPSGKPYDNTAAAPALDTSALDQVRIGNLEIHGSLLATKNSEVKNLFVGGLANFNHLVEIVGGLDLYGKITAKSASFFDDNTILGNLDVNGSIHITDDTGDGNLTIRSLENFLGGDYLCTDVDGRIIRCVSAKKGTKVVVYDAPGDYVFNIATELPAFPYIVDKLHVYVWGAGGAGGESCDSIEDTDIDVNAFIDTGVCDDYFYPMTGYFDEDACIAHVEGLLDSLDLSQYMNTAHLGGGGGGGGGFSAREVSITEESYSIRVGAGNEGSDGGESSFGDIVSAPGGEKGKAAQCLNGDGSGGEGGQGNEETGGRGGEAGSGGTRGGNPGGLGGASASTSSGGGGGGGAGQMSVNEYADDGKFIKTTKVTGGNGGSAAYTADPKPGLSPAGGGAGGTITNNNGAPGGNGLVIVVWDAL